MLPIRAVPRGIRRAGGLASGPGSLGATLCAWGCAAVCALSGAVALAASPDSAAPGANAAAPLRAEAPKLASASKPIAASPAASSLKRAANPNPASAPVAANRPSAVLDGAAVAVPDAAGVVDPQRAFLLRDVFARDVNRRLKVPAAEQRAYAARLQAALDAHELGSLSGEYVVLVDRNANVQALFIYFRAVPADNWQMIGAAPVSTGRPGEYDHFITPLGVFEHTPDNMDFRSEGTQNENHIRGYGRRDMRIFDLGWADGERGWGKGGVSPMRLQMHATDPDRLEGLLGMRHSKGCVRIPATLNTFLDHYGILDAEYAQLIDAGQALWVLKSDRRILPWAGRYIVVVDSQRQGRPAWAPAPGSAARAKMPAKADTAD